MYSHRSEYSHRRQDGEGSSRQWDDYDNRREGKFQSQSVYQQNSPRKDWEDGHSSTERMSRSRKFSSSPNRWNSKPSLNRDWSRSPVRRRESPSVWDASRKGRQRYEEDDDRGFRYRHESLEETRSQSRGFKYMSPHEDDFKLRRTSPDFGSRYRRDESAHRDRREDSSDRSFSGGSSDEDDQKWRRDFSQERTYSPHRFSRKYSDTRGRMSSPPTSVHYEDYQRKASRQSYKGDGAPHCSSVPEKKLGTGFQRFLNVLNKGVNVDTLIKVVSQKSTEVSDEYISQSSLVNTADRSWSPGCPERRQKLQQRSSYSERMGSLASPRPHHRSFSPNRTRAFDDNVSQRSYSRGSSKSPSVEKITLTPEDEAKRAQMQNVLQAIGMDLGFDELGQMTHRIQERLYGKKSDNRGQKLSQERLTSLSSRRRSRSASSSRSTYSPVRQDCFETTERRDLPRYLTKLRKSNKYNQKMSSSSFQDREDGKTNSRESSAAFQAFASTSAPTYTAMQPPPVPPPINSLPLPYSARLPGVAPPIPPSLPPPFFPSLPPPFPPNLPPLFPPNLNLPNHQSLRPPFPPTLPPPLASGLPTPPFPSTFFPHPTLPNLLVHNNFPLMQGGTKLPMPPPTQQFTQPCVNVPNLSLMKKKKINAQRTRVLQVLK